jgi:hypothetical protein
MYTNFNKIKQMETNVRTCFFLAVADCVLLRLLRVDVVVPVPDGREMKGERERAVSLDLDDGVWMESEVDKTRARTVHT